MRNRGVSNNGIDYFSQTDELRTTNQVDEGTPLVCKISIDAWRKHQKKAAVERDLIKKSLSRSSLTRRDITSLPTLQSLTTSNLIIKSPFDETLNTPKTTATIYFTIQITVANK